MFKTLKNTALVFGVTLTVMAITSVAGAQTKIRASATPPGTPPFLFVSTFVDIVNRHVPEVDIQLNATGVATRHYLEATRGTVDIFYSSPLFNAWMTKGTRVYKKVKNGPEIAKKASVLLGLKLAVYHPFTRESSGIKSLKDFKGKKVFLGPPAGAATVLATAIVASATGYKVGKDFQVLRLPWGAGIQAFRDRQVDAMIAPYSMPSAILQQILLTDKIRFLGWDEDDLKKPGVKKLLASPGRTQETIPPGIYGKNQTNTKPVVTIGSWGGIGIRTSVSTDLAYKMTKAFWENIGDAYKKAAAFKEALQLKNAMNQLAGKLHPGAVRYYREKGLAIPARLIP